MQIIFLFKTVKGHSPAGGYVDRKVGIVRTKDVRVLSEQASTSNSDFVLGFNTAFEQYVDPQQTLPERIVVHRPMSRWGISH